jgi:hypothetical protein
MRRFLILLALAVFSLGGATVASATTCNIDFTAQISQTAYDFGIILPNTAIINQTYNGTPGADDVFSGFNYTYTSTGGTYLHWTSPQTPITYGSRIHVGWTTTTNECPKCVTGFFTDINGNKIPGTDVALLAINHAGVANNECAIPITVRNIYGACLSAPIGLAGLNRTNTELSSQLQFLSPGATLQPGTDFAFPLPISRNGGSCAYYAFTYDVSDGQNNAQIKPWVEVPNSPLPPSNATSNQLR